MLSEETVEELARVSCISLTREETARYCRDLNALEEMASVLLTLSPGEAWETGVALSQSLRPDEKAEGISCEAVLQVAPCSSNGYIVVPRTVEE